MPDLEITDMPDHIYIAIEKLAMMHNRSFNDEILVLIERIIASEIP